MAEDLTQIDKRIGDRRRKANFEVSKGASSVLVTILVGDVEEPVYYGPERRMNQRRVDQLPGYRERSTRDYGFSRVWTDYEPRVDSQF